MNDLWIGAHYVEILGVVFSLLYLLFSISRTSFFGPWE